MPDPPVPEPTTPEPPTPPSPPPPDNFECPEAPVNLWINELVWRVNGPGEFVEVAGPPGANSEGWLIGDCDQADGSEGPQTRCRGTLEARNSPREFMLQPVPPLQQSGGLSIATLDIDVRPGTDQCATTRPYLSHHPVDTTYDTSIMCCSAFEDNCNLSTWYC